MADLRDLYRDSRDKRRAVDVECGYCRAKVERVVESSASSWYLRHRCKGEAQRPTLSRAQWSAIEAAFDAFAVLAADLRKVPSGGSLREVDASVRYFGGRRIGFEEPSLAQVEHAAKVDALLVRILGGVPRPPRPPASVVSLPVSNVVSLDERRAARVAA